MPEPLRIGISANRKEGLSCIAETYVRSVLQAGGAPVLIPAMNDREALRTIVRDLDGLVISGGGDIDPRYLDEEPNPNIRDVDTFRDDYDLTLIRIARDYNIPLMGICRGHQMINIALGGGIYQDIYSQNERELLCHSQALPRECPSHPVTILPGTKLYDILKENEIQVNSFHHQAVSEPAPELIPTAVAPDGINEGLEHPEYALFSVQWHPEAMADAGNETMKKLFDYHIAEARRFRQAKEIHERILTIDSHTDTPMIFSGAFDLGEKSGGQVNLPLMEEGRIDAVCMVVYLPQGKTDDLSLRDATLFAVKRLGDIRRQETLHPGRVALAHTRQELQGLKQAGKKAIFLGIENGYAIGKDLRNIARFREMGVCYITLCHNGANQLCDSAKGEPVWNGLSPFGKEVIGEMNRQGILIDISHAAESTFYDVLEASKVPVIASHSSARACCDHPRNLSDKQIIALANKGGVIQVCLYKGFINKNEEKASLSDAIRHINHIVSLVGTEHVGIGSDFDGDGGLIGCRAANELINITTCLLKEGYTADEIANIWGVNLLRVMSIARSAAE